MTEDESHVLFVCSMFGQLREKFPLPVYRGVSMKERYCRLCNNSDDKTLLNMSRFIFFALQLRENLTSEESQSVFVKAHIYCILFTC